MIKARGRLFATLSIFVVISQYDVYEDVQRHADSRVGLTGDSKLTGGVNVSVNSGLSLCVRPATDR